MTNEERIAALEAKVFGKPEPQPEPIDDDLVEAREIVEGIWQNGTPSREQMTYRVLAALKSRPKPRLLAVEEVMELWRAAKVMDPWSDFTARLNAVLQGETK